MEGLFKELSQLLRITPSSSPAIHYDAGKPVDRWIGRTQQKAGKYKQNIKIAIRKMLKGKYIYIYIWKNNIQNQILPSSIETIYNQNQTEVKQSNKTKTPCFGPCVVCPFGAKVRNMKRPKEYRLPLAYHVGTGLACSTGDGEACRDNFWTPEN
jgi:hypothetical protein